METIECIFANYIALHTHIHTHKGIILSSLQRHRARPYVLDSYPLVTDSRQHRDRERKGRRHTVRPRSMDADSAAAAATPESGQDDVVVLVESIS